MFRAATLLYTVPLLLLAACRMVSAAPAPVPVANGGFEEGLGQWAALRPEGYGHGEFGITTAEAHTGKNAIRITTVPEGEKVLIGLTHGRMIALPDDSRTFRLSVWLKANKAPKAIELRIASAGRDGRALTPWQEKGWRFIRPPVDPHVGKWHQAVAEFAAQQEWGGLYLTVWINGAGADVLIDDISLEAVDPTDWMVASVGERLPDPNPGTALWWEGPLRKVFPNEEPPKARGNGIALCAAGDEYEAVQLCVRPARAVEEARVSFTDLAGPRKIPASALNARFVGLIDVKEPKAGRSYTGLTPDPLLPDETATLPAGQTTALWITLKVPRGTPAGDYRGSVTLAGKGLKASVPLSVRVYGFDLPEHPRLRTIARIWQSHEGYMELFRQNLREHRCSGTSYIGGITAKREGDTVVVDTSKLKETADENIRRYGFQVFNVPAIFLGDASGLYAKDKKWQGFEVFTPEFDRAFESYCKQVGDALRAEGLLPYALWQIWDEPQNREMKEMCIHLARLVKKAVPDARIYLTAGVEDELLDWVDIWNLPWPSTYSSEAAAKVRAKGASLWAYENGLYSLDVMDSSLRMRAFPWRLRRYGIEGVEWWAISQWKSDPWTVPNQYAPQNGGGFFLYPTKDRKGAPIDSIRWELYREGVEDYDLLTLFAEEQDRVLKALGVSDTRLSGQAQMLELVSRVALSTVDATDDPRVIEETRRAVAERVEFLRRAPAAVAGFVTGAKGTTLLVTAEKGARVVVDGKPQTGAMISVPVKPGQPVRVEVTRGKATKRIVLR